MDFLKSITATALFTTAISVGTMAAINVDLEDNGAGNGSILKVSYVAVEKALKDEAYLRSDINGTLIHDIIIQAAEEAFILAKSLDEAKYIDKDNFLAELKKELIGTIDIPTYLNPGSDENSVTDKDTREIIEKLTGALIQVLKLGY